ncbi:hypothetical protein GDO78_022962 [Eleutherodactylus coqui]|uniref:Uncharacterized protein n=1 Tax=Eleutherodactylus coqui TaxID=57060 RepID=A0A8J6EFQ4_ELECQ|nr:hypothetical protein GDO78_022962 [Eleutherodactylus coqui]
METLAIISQLWGLHCRVQSILSMDNMGVAGLSGCPCCLLKSLRLMSLLFLAPLLHTSDSLRTTMGINHLDQNTGLLLLFIVRQNSFLVLLWISPHGLHP